MPNLFNRKPDGTSVMSARGIAISQRLAFRMRKLIAEVEEDGPVDLRDLMTVISEAGEDACVHEMLVRQTAARRSQRATHTQGE